MKNKNLQHSQLPEKMSEQEMSAKDQLIYADLRSYMNGKTMKAYPALSTIAKDLGVHINTVKASIKRLEEKGYIEVIENKGKTNIYIFKKLDQFEPFSIDFLRNNKYTFATKAYIVASQQFMFKDEIGVGKLSYTNRVLSKKINMPESTIRKCDRELEELQCLIIESNNSIDLETGCKGKTKVFDMNRLNQAIIWILKDHHQKLNQVVKSQNEIVENQNKTKEEVEELKKEVKFLRKEYEKQKEINYILINQNKKDKFEMT